MREGEGKPVTKLGGMWVGLEGLGTPDCKAARRDKTGWSVVNLLPNWIVALSLMESTELALKYEQNDVTRILLEHSSDESAGWCASKPGGVWLIQQFAHDSDRANRFRELQEASQLEEPQERAPVGRERVMSWIVPSRRTAVDGDIQDVLDGLGAMMQAKRESYGNSVGKPVGIFHKGSPVEGILARIDDKLGRVKTGRLMWNDEDVIEDLLGYLVLLKIARGR